MQQIIKLKKILAAVAERSNNVAVILSIILIILTVVFLCNNCFQTIGDIKVLGALKSQVSIKVVDMAAWQKISDQITDKKQPLGEWRGGQTAF